MTERSLSYEYCREVAARHGRSYYLAARLLPAERRRAIHALYAFARRVDDLVDEHPTATDTTRLRLLTEVESALRAGFGGSGNTPAAPSTLAPVLPAFFDSVERFAVPHGYFTAFLESMRMDVPGADTFRASYASLEELREYMYGSAVVIGLQLLPVLGTVCPAEDAAPYAAHLGEAFQLTNFLRDVGEDLDRGRVYLPEDALAAFGVDADLLRHCRRTGSVDPRVRRALAHLVAVTRDTYRRAAPGIDLLDARVRPGIRTARSLYGRILDEIENSGYRVASERVVVPGWRRVAVVTPELFSWLRRPSPVLAG